MQSSIIGIDVGGTFTDFIAFDPRSGRVTIEKRPTTTIDQSEGVMEGLGALGTPFNQVQQIVHGTTTATNAVIERKGSKCALVTTRGFRDVLECGRRDRPTLYGLRGSFEPLISRDARFEISERLDYRGEAVESISEEDLADTLKLIEAGDFDAVAVCFLHSYANDVHEAAVSTAIEDRFKEIYVARSSTLYGQLGEFERSSTAVISAYVGSLMRRYFHRLDQALRGLGYERDFMVVLSNGGAASHRIAARFPATTIKSGPSAGATAASIIAQAESLDRLISLDMGGTSADIAVSVEGKVARKSENSIGFRLPLQVPMLDISTIGAGGGSIARRDDAGVLKVGPDSAGSIPGPACYGRGGTDATVTDAHVVLGHMLPTAAAANGIPLLDVAAARDVISKMVASPLGIGLEEAAAAVIEVVNENMAGQVQLVTIDHGLDVREFWLTAFGGAGPLHACSIVRRLDMKGALLPVFPGLASALGCALCDVRHEFAHSFRTPLSGITDAELSAVLESHRQGGEALLSEQGLPIENLTHEVSLSMFYQGQRHSIDLTFHDPHEISCEVLEPAFRQAYQARYGAILERPIVLVSVQSTISTPLESLDLKACFQTLRRSDSRLGQEDVVAYFRGEPVTTRVVDRSSLGAGSIVNGPAIISQRDCTILVDPDFRAEVTELGNMCLVREE